MPTSDRILLQVTTTSHELVWLAVAWHAVLLLALVALVALHAPRRLVAVILTSGLAVSVSVASFAYGNPFNGISLAALAICVVVAGTRHRHATTSPVPLAIFLIGLAAIAYGWTYSHFVQAPWFRVAWAAPLGVVPCPTIAMIAGITILIGGFGSRWFVATLAAWTVFYGVVGIWQFGIVLDVGLLVLAGALAIMARKRRHSFLLREHRRPVWRPMTTARALQR